MFSVSVDRHRTQRGERLRRRAAATAVASRVLVENRAHQAVRRRDRLFRRALVGADLLAGLLVVGLADRIFGVFGLESFFVISYVP